MAISYLCNLFFFFASFNTNWPPEPGTNIVPLCIELTYSWKKKQIHLRTSVFVTDVWTATGYINVRFCLPTFKFFSLFINIQTIFSFKVERLVYLCSLIYASFRIFTFLIMSVWTALVPVWFSNALFYVLLNVLPAMLL